MTNALVVENFPRRRRGVPLGVSPPNPSTTVEARADAKAQVHGVLAKHGVKIPVTDLFGVAGNVLLDKIALDDAYLVRVESLRDLVALSNREVAMLDRLIAGRLEGHSGYEAILAIPGVGKVLAAVFVARSATSAASPGLSSWPLGGDDAPPPRVRHHGPPGPHHQARQPPGAPTCGLKAGLDRPHRHPERPRGFVGAPALPAKHGG